MSDAPKLLLDHHLKTLKLPTFIREYDILDRLRHRAHVLNIKGRSYRLRDLEEALRA